MVLTLLIALVVTDLVLAFMVFRLKGRWQTHDDILSDITEERQMISRLQKSLKDEVKEYENEFKSIYKKVGLIAAQVEQETALGNRAISEQLRGIVEDAKAQVSAPVEELTLKQRAIEDLLVKIDQEKSRLAKVVVRGEKILSCLAEGAPLEEFVKDLEQKKYSDARQLVAQGMAPDQVAAEIGLSVAEVQMIRGLHSTL